jgi:hypothetical protein
MNVSMRLFALVVITFSAVRGLSQYTARVVNFDSSPVIMKPLNDGPGFTVKNKSDKQISQFRFGCVKEANDGHTVPFAFIPERVSLDPKGPQRSKTFKGWTPAQGACANRASKVAVIEVLFSDGSSWSAPLKFEKVLGPPEPIAIP